MERRKADASRVHCAGNPLLQGMFSDPTLLDISDVELADIKFLEEDPVVVVQFNCQQVRLRLECTITL